MRRLRLVLSLAMEKPSLLLNTNFSISPGSKFAVRGSVCGKVSHFLRNDTHSCPLFRGSQSKLRKELPMPLHCEVCASVAVVHPEAEAKDLVHCEWQESEILRLRLRMTVMQFSRSDTLPKWRQMFLKGLRALFLLKACKRHTLAFVMDKPDQCRS